MAIKHQLSAHYVFVCQALQDDLFAPCIGKKTKVVNLWHGLPLKKIMYDVFGDKKHRKNMVGRLVDALSPYEKTNNDYLLATSVETQKTISKAFRISKESTLITGFPRNDVFLNQAKTKISTLYQCIYMPTFRGGIGTEYDLFTQYGFDVDEIEKTLSANNIELILRMHPVNQPPKDLFDKIKKSAHIRIDESEDIFDSIAQYDCMVTDYSGGYFDFLLSGKPVLFAPFDLEQYKKQERNLYYHYEEVTLKPYAYSWPELIENIVNFKSNPYDEKYFEAYSKLNKRFHAPLNTQSDSFSSNLYHYLSQIK